MARPKKITAVEFARDYIELKALDKTDHEIADHFGVSTRTIKRYLKREDFVNEMSKIDIKPLTDDEKTADNPPSPSTEVNQKIAELRSDKIKEGIDEGKEKADRILNTAYNINMQRIKNYLQQDDIDEAGKIALSLLGLAERYNRRNEAIQQILQINYDQRQGISEPMFFGSIRYGLQILGDKEAVEVMQRIEDYLRERNAIARLEG